MSCLSKSHRINNSKDFSKLYKSGKKWHSSSFIAFFQDSQCSLQIACVASKKVGNAVVRNQARRRLKALFLEFETQLKHGQYVVVAKDAITDKDYDSLKKDFIWTMKRLNLFL